ncbi:hypothetical protein BDV12DRAFT_193571 [Aspergillus spectabilis]
MLTGPSIGTNLELTKGGSVVENIFDSLIDLALMIEPSKFFFSPIDLVKPPTHKASHQLEHAWLHLLMSLVHLRNKPNTSQQHRTICMGLVEVGLKRVDDAIDKQTHQKEKAVLPLDIMTMNVEKIESDKGRQHPAIYAFTIVTIIFLPLSTVSSNFGMNTVDIRNIEDGQWIYWAVAIPLTIVIMVFTPFWAGELETVFKVLRDLI